MKPSVAIRSVCLLAAGQVAGAPSVFAQGAPPDSVSRLPAVEVTASVLSAAGASTASGLPARTAVIPAEGIHASGLRTVADALATQPGAALYDDLGSPYRPTLVIRGFTASGVVGLPQGVTVFIDGIPVNEPDAGQVNFELLPLAHAVNVEVFSGTASLLGPNSLAGAVNVVTNRGGGAPRGRLALSAGSFGRRSASGAAMGEARGWSYYAGGELADEGGWRQLTGASLGSAFLSAGRYGGSHGAGIQLLAARSRAETAGSLPESVRDVRPDSNLSAGDFEDLRQLHVSADGYVPLAGGRATLRTFVRLHDAERFNVNQIDDPDVRGFSENRSAGLHADWTRVIPTGSGAVGLRAGVGGSVHGTGIRLYAERLDPGLTTDVESPIRKADGWLLGTWTRGAFALSGGARYDVVRIPFRNRLRPERDTTSTYAHLSPRAGISIALGQRVTLFGSAGRSFRAPAVIELACADPEEPCPLPFALGDDPPLAPVVATTAESGLRWLNARWSAELVAYRTNVRDDIFLMPYRDEAEPAGSTIDGYFANIPRTRREGVELALDGRVHSLASARLAYGLARATFQSDAELFSVREAAGEENVVAPGDRIPLVPDRTLAAGITFHLLPGANVDVQARHVGRRWLRGDEANDTAPLGGHTTVAMRGSVVRGTWSLDAAVTNLFDRRYVAFGTFNINQGGGGTLERFLTPGEPRAILVTVGRTFGG